MRSLFLAVILSALLGGCATQQLGFFYGHPFDPALNDGATPPAMKLPGQVQ